MGSVGPIPVEASVSEDPQFTAQQPNRPSLSIEAEERIAELIAELLYEQMIKSRTRETK